MLSTSAISQDFGRMMELAQQGFHCSDILVSMGLEAQGKVNPDAVRLASALAGGVIIAARTAAAQHERSQERERRPARSKHGASLPDPAECDHCSRDVKVRR